MSLTRKLGSLPARSAAPQFAKIDPAEAESEIWSIIKRNAASVTPYYLLTAPDLTQDTYGSIARNEKDQAVFLDTGERSESPDW